MLNGLERSFTERMKVQSVNIQDVKPYPNNPRNNDSGIDAVANSIKEFGWQQPIVVDKDNVIIVGHTRYLAAKKLGLKEVPVKVATGLTPEQVKAYRLADNKTGELTSWDDELLGGELNDILDIDMSGFGFDEENDVPKFDDEYSQKTDAIEYKPHEKEKPSISELADTTKYEEVKQYINSLDIDDEIKNFLLLGATRFIKFDFAKIAEYYAHSNGGVQKAFEEQLLVIIDYDDALIRGIAKFKDNIRSEELSAVGEVDERLR